MSEIKVRFAPSPTGYLHVGGARTALFNWLYAKKVGGKFVLRIEDTDQERSTEESYQAILRGMEWLGMDWDEGPILQSDRLEIYKEHADKLKETGAIYPCYCKTEEIAKRNTEAGEVDNAGYDGHCRNLSAEQIAAFEADDREARWRLRTPDEGSTFWYDIVMDKLEFPNSAIVDRVMIKPDGFPTYNFAVVIDDYLMGITHVLRGDDHVSNTPLHLMIYDSLGWNRPKYGHMPMILGPDGKRLSKRHGATSVEEFSGKGILPDAMMNYLALLGWSPGATGDGVFTRSELIKKFSLKKVNSSPASFDYDKLAFINAQHLKRLEPKDKLALCEPICDKNGWDVSDNWKIPASDRADYLNKIIKVLGGRFSDLNRLPEMLAFFFSEDYEFDQEAVAENLTDEAKPLMQKLADRIESDSSVSAEEMEASIKAVATEFDVKPGIIIHPTRVALTGTTRSAGMYDVMYLVGGPRVVERLRKASI
jgi:glutamyl-tRNA synthetase